MSNTWPLRARLHSAVVHASLRSSHVSTRSPSSWIRTITSTHARSQPAVSFGAEADAIIFGQLKQERQERQEPPSMRRPAPKIEPREKKSRTNKFRSPREAAHREKRIAAPSGEDFEITTFIDRSASAQQAQSEPEHTSEDGKSQAADSRRKPTRQSKRGNMVAEKSSTSKETGSGEISERPKPESWAIQKRALREKFQGGWNPRKKLSPDAMEGIRGLHEQDPMKYSTPVLAEQFKVSPEAIRRILKSKWMSKQPFEKVEERRDRWAKRHDRIWDHQAELGLRPKRTRDAVPEDPDKFDQDLERRRVLGEIE